MSERHDRPPARPAAPAEFDREIDVRSVALFGFGLALVMTVVLAALWIALVHWKTRQVARDPRPSPIAEANAPRLPPEPRLQAAPVKDMEALRARETSVLTTYGWVDRRAGLARIPIERAIDLILENGLPVPKPEASPAPRAAGPPRSRGRRKGAARAGGATSGPGEAVDLAGGIR